MKQRPDPTYFFLSGAAKSGTTWINWMLNTHPQVLMLGEGFFAGPFGVLRCFDEAKFREWASYSTVTNSWLKGVAQDDALTIAQRAVVKSMLDQRLARETEKSNVIALGDKTPFAYCEDPALIRRLFPQARFINVLRDGRDMAVSYMFMLLKNQNYRQFRPESQQHMAAARRFYLEKQGDPCPLFCDELVDFMASSWSLSVRGGELARQLFGTNYTLVRYEAYLAEPTLLKGLFEFLGVDAGDHHVQRCIEHNDFSRLSGGRTRGTTDATSFFRSGTHGDWRNHFTPSDSDRFKRIAGQLLIDQGYERDLDW